MLSTEPIKNVGQAAHYFMGQDNYYLADAEGKERSEWWGKGAKELGLEAQVDECLFTKLLNGQLPNGEQLGSKENGEIKHRPGFDLTFSVPKSVSIAALLGGDQRILEALSRATDTALSRIENDCAQARITQEGITTYQDTKNLVVAKFLHDISREGDPQLHIHCVVMNMTLRSDGKWRSLASKSGDYSAHAKQEINGFFEQVRHNKQFYGMLFRAELAYELNQLNYSIVKKENGFFEIEGISEANIYAHSTRRRQIEAYMEDYGYSGAKAASVANLKTRRVKNINRETLRELWESRNQTHQIDGIGEAKRVVEAALNPSQSHNKKAFTTDSMTAAREAVQVAMTYLSETQVAIQQMQLINVALQYALGERINLEAILKAIDEQRGLGELIPLKNRSGHVSYTTKRLVEYEQAIIKAIKQVNKHGQALLPHTEIESFLLENPQLTVEQQQAIRIFFSSPDKIMALEGSVGSGKTTLIKPMMELARLSGYRPILLTPNKASAVHLEHEFRSTPKSLREWIKQLFHQNQYDTISGFLKKQEAHPQSLSKRVIFVDKAMMLASKPMHSLVKLVQQSKDAYLIVIDDSKNLLPWQAGTPFLQMIQHGVTKATLSKNLKSQHEMIKTAIVDTLQNNIANAFDKIGHRIISIDDKDELLKAMATHYAALTKEERKNTLVLMPTKQKCHEINGAIRKTLKQHHAIHESGITVEALLPKNLKEIEYRFARSYQPGQVIRFNGTYFSLRVAKGEYCKIKEINRHQNIVILENAKGRSILWNPAKVEGKSGKIEVFEPQAREIVVGDRLTWQRHDYRKKLYKGECLKITKIDGQRIQVARQNGKILQINLKNPQTRHFDYGYSSTLHQTPEINSQIIMAYQNSASRQSHQRQFYRTIAKATQQVWLYTEVRKQLLNQIQKYTGDKTTALNTLLGNEYLDKSWGGHYALLEKAVSNAIYKFQQNNVNEKNSQQISQEAVQYALAHLAEREAAFDHKKVMLVALKYALGDTRSNDIEAAILEAEQKGDLIRGLYSKNGTHWTTREALAIERENVQLAREHQGKLTPLASQKLVESHLQKTNPKDEHKEVVRAIANCQDRIVLIQGHAGTGKTTMLKNVDYLLQDVQALLNQQGNQLLCLAPTNQAVKELRERRLEAQTADSFIAEFKLLQSRQEALPKYQYQRVIAVDESSMLSNRRFNELLKITQLTKTRLLFVGDEKQYPAIESGKPFIILLYSGLKVIYLTEIERQKDKTLHQAVGQVYQGEFKEAFKTLAQHIVEIGQEKIDGKIIDQRDKRLEAISEDYLSRSLLKRAQTMIITLGNDDRETINELVRAGLKDKGELYGDAVVAHILVPRDMTKVELTRSANYKSGNIIRFNYADRECGIEKDQYLTVQAIDRKNNLLTLLRDNGETVAWKPPKNLNDNWSGVEVYEGKQREIQAGDLIRWTRTDKDLGFLSPELVRVEKVSQGECLFREIIITDKGIVASEKVFEVYPQKQAYQHWDYAYAMTGYSAQGKSIKYVLLHLESFRKYLASQPSVLVMLTRAIYGLTIYTDNQEKLINVILGNTGEKSSALEILGEWERNSEKTSQANLKLFHASSQKLTPNFKQKMHSYDVRRILQLLNEDAELVLKRVLGEPKERSSGQYRYGSNKGSLVVTLTGEKRGLWHDFQTGEGGDLLRLIAKEMGLNIKEKADFKKTIYQALSILGVSEELVLTKSKLDRSNKNITSQNPKELKPKQIQSIEKARRLAEQSLPIENTLAERYLREHRGINVKNIPESFRFHPNVYSLANGASKPALLIIAKDSDDKVQAVQAIFLDKRTANKANVKVKKQTWGVLAYSGASASISNKQGGFVYLAEGPETALSIYEAMPNADIKITLSKSNFKNVDIKDITRPVVICLDNDGDNPSTDRLLQFVSERLLTEGRQVWIAKPEQIGKDHNDLLKERGVHAVKNNIENAIPYEDYRDQKNTGLILKTAMTVGESMKYSGESCSSEIIERFIRTNIHNTLSKDVDIEKLHDFRDKLINEENSKVKTFISSISNKANNQIIHKHGENISVKDKQLFIENELEQ